jgi:hypothetical protein
MWTYFHTLLAAETQLANGEILQVQISRDKFLKLWGVPEYQQCPKETHNILNLTEHKLKIIHKDGILCRTDYEVLELQKNTRK